MNLESLKELLNKIYQDTIDLENIINYMITKEPKVPVSEISRLRRLLLNQTFKLSAITMKLDELE